MSRGEIAMESEGAQGQAQRFGVEVDRRAASDRLIVLPDFQRPLAGDPAEEPVVEEGGKFRPDHVAVGEERLQKWSDLIEMARASEIDEKNFCNRLSSQNFYFGEKASISYTYSE